MARHSRFSGTDMTVGHRLYIVIKRRRFDIRFETSDLVATLPRKDENSQINLIG